MTPFPSRPAFLSPDTPGTRPLCSDRDLYLSGCRDLYYGSNGYNYVYSFLPSSTITSFSADVNAFLKYLTSEQSLPSSQYLTTFEAGSEATSGSDVTLEVSAYSAVISS